METLAGHPKLAFLSRNHLAAGTSAFLASGLGCGLHRVTRNTPLLPLQKLQWKALSSLRPIRSASQGNVVLAQQASSFQWTPGKIALSLALFIAAGLAEIAGGWLVWQAVRGHFADKAKPFLQNKNALVSAAAGSCCLVGYGILPTAQPLPAFGRIYAVYGGFFVALSYAWGWLVDGEKPDRGDCIGAAMAISGCALAWFWPRPY